MDLNSIGKHCALQSCNILDFLPIQCSCLQWFCKLHISPDLHDCSSLRRGLFQSPSSSVQSRCAVLACNKPSLVIGVVAIDSISGDSIPGGCPGCHLSFCVDHRHMQSHSCVSPTIRQDDAKHEVARAILAQKLSASSTPTSRTPLVTRRPTKLSCDPKALAQKKKVNLIKLRHKAVPADPKDRSSTIPIDQRVHATARLSILGQPEKEIALWFRKTTVAGKALDLVVQHFGVTSAISTLHLEQSSAEFGSLVLQNHLQLLGQLEDGSTVVLTDSCVQTSTSPAGLMQ